MRGNEPRNRKGRQAFFVSPGFLRALGVLVVKKHTQLRNNTQAGDYQTPIFTNKQLF
jgi:hypothetical protein